MRTRSLGILVCWVLLGVVVGVAVYPLIGVPVEVGRAVGAGTPDGAGLSRVELALFVRTLAVAGGIALLSVLFAWPAARVLASGRGWLTPILLVPMLLPAYLAYSGWGELRSPGTALGDWLVALGGRGHRWVPIFVGRGLAVVGLALWASPIASVVMAMDLSRRGRALDERLRLDTRTRGQRLRMRARIACKGIGAAWGGVALLMLGSAVPLHLAQIDTASALVWRRLSETSPDAWGGVWLGVWPMVVIALCAAGFVAWRVMRLRRWTHGDGSSDIDPAPASAGVRVAAWTVWAAAVLVPVALFVRALGSMQPMADFWRLEGGALGVSLMRAGVAGGLIAVLAACCACLLADRSRAARLLVGTALIALLAIGLSPGVLIGSAIARTGMPGWLAPTVAHVARFGFIGVLAGVGLALVEPPERRALRALSARSSVAAWAATALPGQWWGFVGAGLGGACLALHEIEATVFVQPPGSGALAQRMLEQLHYQRMTDLAASVLVVVGIGLVLGLNAAGLVWWGQKNPSLRSKTRSDSAS